MDQDDLANKVFILDSSQKLLVDIDVEETSFLQFKNLKFMTDNVEFLVLQILDVSNRIRF